jgi:hypothetical protein
MLLRAEKEKQAAALDAHNTLLARTTKMLYRSSVTTQKQIGSNTQLELFSKRVIYGDL